MEFQFGTNWAAFSRAAGGVIGQTLAMEGVFFFFSSNPVSSVYFYLARKNFGRIGHCCPPFWYSSARGSPATSSSPPTHGCNHPTGYVLGPHGEIELSSFWSLVVNKWALWQYAHTMLGAVQNRLLRDGWRRRVYLLTPPRRNLRPHLRESWGARRRGCRTVATHSHWGHARETNHRASTCNARSHGRLFQTQSGAPLAILGQPDVAQRKLDNPLEIPNVLSFLTYRKWSADVRGLDAFPRKSMARHDSASLLQLSTLWSASERSSSL